MNEVPGLLDLSIGQINELGVRIVHEDGRARIFSNYGMLFEIRHGIGSDEQRDITKYHVRMCYSGFPGEAQTSRLRLRNSGTTIGYVFPLTALRDAEHLGDVWPRRFADVGFRSTINIETLSRFANVGSVGGYRDQALFLDELLSDDLSILVVGYENIKIGGISAPVLELMLLKEGITLLSGLEELRVARKADNWRYQITMAKPGEIVTADAAIFLNLIKSADQDRIGVGAFMHLYQAMEFCIDHIFSWGIEKIAHSNFDTWEMKNRLSEITGEKHRLRILDTECLSSLQNRTSLSELRDSCQMFLTAVGVDYKEDSGWYSLLYKARNIIVHNQIKMMRAATVPLTELNSCLRVASLDILFAFDKPTEGGAAKIDNVDPK